MALFAVGTVAMAGTAVAPSFGAGASAADGEIYLVQGLPGVQIDVSVDGHSVADNLKTAAVAGPFKVAGGERTVTVRSGGKVLLQRQVDIKAKSSSDVVVHLPARGTGDATITAYRNNLWKVPSNKAALTIAHTAAVPAADIRVNNKVLFADISNGESLSLVVPVATYKVGIVPTGKSAPYYFGPVDLTVKGGALNRVYAIGDPSKKTMNVAVHVLTAASMGSATPKHVNTGTGGQAVHEQVAHYYNLMR